mmetsp:Transcript_43570/g.105141  ORF Transcript_43570/g.105141 Transcript_43570/m.105141 type:complete len:231 (-) Transcript_43570:1927-2619(-)
MVMTKRSPRVVMIILPAPKGQRLDMVAMPKEPMERRSDAIAEQPQVLSLHLTMMSSTVLIETIVLSARSDDAIVQLQQELSHLPTTMISIARKRDIAVDPVNILGRRDTKEVTVRRGDANVQKLQVLSQPKMTEADARLHVRKMNLPIKTKPFAKLLGMIVGENKTPTAHRSFGWPVEMPNQILYPNQRLRAIVSLRPRWLTSTTRRLRILATPRPERMENGTKRNKEKK